MGQTSITINLGLTSMPPWVKGALAAFGGAAAGVVQEAMTAEHFNFSPESLKHTAIHALGTGALALMLYFVKPPTAQPTMTATTVTGTPEPPAPPAVTPPAGGSK